MALPSEQRSSLGSHPLGGGSLLAEQDGVRGALGAAGTAAERPQEGPIPMSMPAILRNPRLRYLQPPARVRPAASPGSAPRGEAYRGKRRMRRSENSRFLSNPHTVRPSAIDFEVRPNEVRSTFSVQRNGHVTCLESISESHVPDFASPQHDTAAFEVASAMKGQFTMSLRDAQQFLRARRSQSGPSPSAVDDGMVRAMDAMSLAKPSMPVALNPRTFMEQLIATAEHEIASWLQQTVHMQDDSGKSARREILARPASSVRESTAIWELRRTPSLLVWHVDDAYNRLAVHCVARVLNCPSFSRPVLSGERVPGQADRHTWILHPNPLVRGKRTRGTITRRAGHTRTSSTSTVGSATSSAMGPDPDTLPLTAGILQQSFDFMQSPPVTDIEYTSAEEFTESERGDVASDWES